MTVTTDANDTAARTDRIGAELRDAADTMRAAAGLLYVAPGTTRVSALAHAAADLLDTVATIGASP